MKLRSVYPWPWACDGMLTGMPPRVVSKSVPWSRLKPRRKYWFAFPPPLCWVTIIPGMYSITSAGRSIGRSAMSCGLMWPALAASEVPTALS